MSMPSTTLAVYQVLRDGPFTLADSLGDPNEETFGFEVPGDFFFGDGVRKPIISFRVRPYQNSRFEIFLNHREVTSHNLNTSHTRGYFEAISARTAFPESASIDNPVPVRFFVNSGRVRFSDVVIWYHIKRFEPEA